MAQAALQVTTSTNAPSRAIIYTRVSSDRAKGRSVAEQEAECRTECERRDWPVAEVLSDNDRSATRYATKDRPEYERLRTPAPAGRRAGHVGSQPGDPFARPVRRSAGAADRAPGLWCPTVAGSSTSPTATTVSPPVWTCWCRRAQAEDTRNRIRRAHRANLAAGKPHGRRPFGYRIVRDPETGKSTGREPHPIEAPLLQEAARRVLDGHSTRSVVRWLKEQDDDGDWTITKLKKRLCNAIYAGFRTHADDHPDFPTISGPGTWEPLWSLETHNDIVAMFAARSTGQRGMAVRYLLTGIATCAVCGAKLQRAKVKDVSTLSCPDRHLGRKMETVDAVVTEVIEALISTPEVADELAAAPPVDATAKARLVELRERLEAVETETTEGRMPPATGARIATRLEAQIAQAEADATPVITNPVVHSVVTAPDPVETWRALPLEFKREFIRAVMTIKIERVGRGRWHAKEAGILITPRRAPPRPWRRPATRGPQHLSRLSESSWIATYLDRHSAEPDTPIGIVIYYWH